MRVRADGGIVWRAELPDPDNRYVEAELARAGVDARALSYSLRLDLNTGRILERTWTK